MFRQGVHPCTTRTLWHSLRLWIGCWIVLNAGVVVAVPLFGVYNLDSGSECYVNDQAFF